MPVAGRHERAAAADDGRPVDRRGCELLRGLGGAGVMTEAEGDFEALMRMGVTFARKKSEHYEFGTAIMLTRYSSNDINTARGSHKLSMVSSD